jgi:putative ABC transport system substrate-binding protein
MALNAKRILVLAAIALAGFIVRLPLAAAAPPGHTVRVTPGISLTLAAAEVTKTVPIVMVGATDVVDTGLVASLARPGGNVTGLAINAAEIAAKRLQLLQEAVPGLSRVAILWNARFPAMVLQFHNIELASPQLGVILQSIRVTGGSDDFDQAFAAIEASHSGQ